jgi:uncharacterized iron-regulated membrane protein
MNIRKAILTVHLWLGFISGTLLFLVAITGCVLAFEDELRYLTQHDVLYVPVADTPQLSVRQMVAEIKKYDPEIELNQVRFYGDPSKAAQCYTRDKRIIGINQYTGQVLGARYTEKDWISLTLSFHRTLLLGKTGERIILWNVWIFLVMLVSGLFLWLPPRWKQIGQNLVLKRGLLPKRRNYEWHRMLGLYAWLPLFIIAITGISMASGGGDKGPKTRSIVLDSTASPDIYDRVLHQAYHQEPLEVLRVTFPKDSADVITIGIRYETNGLRKQSNFLFDQYSAALLKTDSYQDKPFGQRFFGSSFELHTGRILGIPGKIIMFLAGLIAASLPVTGFLIWKGKRSVAAKRYPVAAGR